MDKKSLPKEEVKLPKPEVELPKPETDLPLPEKNLPKSENVKASSPEEVLPIPASSFQPSYMWLKLLALTLVLILIFISGFMLLQNNSTKTLPPTPTPMKTVDETANWKTYTDDKTHVSFKYPRDWIFNTLKGYAEYAYEAHSPDYNGINKGPNVEAIAGKQLTLSVNHSLFTSYEEFKKNILANTPPKGSSINELVMGTNKCSYSIYTNTITECWFFYNNNEYAFALNSNGNQQDLFKLILSTVKFTDQNLPASNAASPTPTP